MRSDLLAGLVLLSLGCSERVVIGQELPVETDGELGRARDGGAPSRDGGPTTSGLPPVDGSVDDRENNGDDESESDTDSGSGDDEGDGEAGDNDEFDEP